MTRILRWLAVPVVAAMGCGGDAATLDVLVGKTVIVGVTLVDTAGQMMKRVEAHGTVKGIDQEAGVVIERDDDESGIFIPPDLASFHPIPPGTYREVSTGVVIPDPAYLTVWEARLGGMGMP